MDFEIFKRYKEKLNLKAVDVQTTSPLILAYIGDCLYDLAVREYMVSNFPGVVNAVNQKKTTFVCAHAQSEIMGYLIGQGVLTDEEMSVYRRGRNQKSAPTKTAPSKLAPLKSAPLKSAPVKSAFCILASVAKYHVALGALLQLVLS